MREPGKIRIGEARLDPSTCRLDGPDGQVRLEPRVVDMVVQLARCAGEVISRDQLIDSVWTGYPGADQSLTAAVSKFRRALANVGADTRLIETVPKRGYRLKIAGARDRPRDRGPGVGLAVLPFRNLSGLPEDEHLCEGLAEELISVLTGVREVRVAARTSSFTLTRRQVSLAELGTRLNVDYVIDGSVQRSGDRLRVWVNLLEAESETQLWSRDFDHGLSDLLAIQDTIAGTVLLETLRRIGVEARPVRAAQTRSKSSEALNAYLKGRYFWRRENVNPGKALQYFHRAIELDSEFAAPYAGLVDCYCTYGVWQLIPQEEARGRALDFAEQALALAPESSDVQFSHGYAQFYARWRWPAAERAMRRALEIEPEHVLAHSFLGLLMAVQHRDEEAKRFVDRLVDIDPLSPWCWTMRGLIRYYLRDFPVAVDSANEALELEGDDLFALWVMSTALAHLGRAEALELTKQLETEAVEADLFLGCAAANYALCGEHGEAERVLRKLRSRDEERGVSPLVFSFVFAAMGLPDNAVQAMEKAFEQRNMAMFYISREPHVDSIRERPEFQELLRVLGLGRRGNAA